MISNYTLKTIIQSHSPTGVVNILYKQRTVIKIENKQVHGQILRLIWFISKFKMLDILWIWSGIILTGIEEDIFITL